MNLDRLLAKLSEIDVTVAEERKLADGTRILILTSKLSFFPLKPHQRWYTLVLRKDQDDVREREVEAILRHFWHAELEWFKRKADA